MLDTQLASNDGAPFKIPGVGNVTEELELAGDAVPDFWQSFDDLANPILQTQGTFVGLQATRPDRVVWADWGRLASTRFDFTVDPTQDLTGDSAVGIYWNPSPLGPGETRTYTTYYGLGNIEIVQADLTLGLSGPGELSVQGNAYTPNPFTVSLIAGNTANGEQGTAQNVTATLVLPAGLQLVAGESEEHHLGDIPVGSEAETSWQVMATGSPFGLLVYSVDVDGDNISPAQIQRQVIVPELAGTSPTPTQPPVSTPTPTPFPSEGVSLHPGFEQGVFVGRGLGQSSVAVGDIDEDGFPEIVIGGGDGGLYAFNGNGTPVVESGQVPTKGKDVPDATPGLLFLTPLESDGTRLPILSTPTLADVDSDKRVDMLWGTDGGEVYRLELRLSTDPPDKVKQSQRFVIRKTSRLTRPKAVGDPREVDDVGARRR